MTDKKLDNLKDPVDSAISESERPKQEVPANQEKETQNHEQPIAKKSTLEKYANKLVPSKAKKVIKPIPQIQDEVLVKIEKILESGLADEYTKLSPITKQEFKIKGEETTAKIRELLQATHIKVKKIFYLIVEWLRILPGINKFFLEQEAKIKTDQIIELYKKQKEKDLNKIL